MTVRQFQQTNIATESAWRMWNGQIRPTGYHHNGVTYLTYGEYNPTTGDVDLHATGFSHSTGDWLQSTQIGTVPTDNHYLSSISVDSDGYIYVFYRFRQDQGLVKVSDSPEDLSSFSQGANIGPSGANRNYNNSISVGNTVYVLNRAGSPSSGSLMANYTTDRAASFSEVHLVDGPADNRGMYPANKRYDGTHIHILTGGRRGPGDKFDYLAHLKLDPTDNTIYSTDGTQLPEPSTKSDLSNNNSIIQDSPETVYGNGLTIHNGDPYVAYVQEDGSGNLDLQFSKWDSGSSAWTQTTVASNIPQTSSADQGFLGPLLELSTTDGSSVKLWESIWMHEDAASDAGVFESTDGGSSWSARGTARDFSEYPDYVSHLQQVMNYNSDLRFSTVQWVPSNDAGRTLVFSEDWTDATALGAVTPQSIQASDGSGFQSTVFKAYDGTAWQNHGHIARVDTFERGDVTPYSGDTGYYTTDNSWANFGTLSLRGSTNGDSYTGIVSTSGLAKYPVAGERFRVDCYQPNTDPGLCETLFGYQSESFTGDGYKLQYDTAQSPEIKLFKREGGSQTTLATDGLTAIYQEPVTKDVKWLQDGTIEADILDTSGQSILDNPPLTANDTTHQQGGVGFVTNFNTSVDTYFHWDNFRVIDA